MESPLSSGIRYRPSWHGSHPRRVGTVVTMSNDEPGPASSAPRVESDAHRGRTRALVTALAASAALLLGIGVGFAIGNAGGSDQGRDQANATAVGFAQDMIVHHRQAVEMTQAVIEHGSDPAVRALARRMGSAQTTEIGQMTGWLQAWGPGGEPRSPDVLDGPRHDRR